MEVIRYLKQWEKQQTRALYEVAFPEDSGSFVDYYYQWKTPENRILVMEGQDGIQVMLHLNPYTFQICGTRRQIPYIVAVATRPDCRRQGKMERIMKRLLRDLEQQKLPFTLLLPADPAYYRGQGFVFFPRQNSWEIPPAASHSKAAETEWRQAGEEDIPELVKLANAVLQKNSRIFAVRDHAYYRRLLAETQVEHGGVLLLTSSGKICGSLVYGLESEEKPAAEIKELLLEFPAEPEEIRALCEKGLPDCEISFASPRMMVRIASLEAFVSMLKREQPRSFFVKVTDSVLENNCGCYRISLDAEGGKLEKLPDSRRELSEYQCEHPESFPGGTIQEMDISRLAQELLQDISLDFREWV